MMPILRHRHTGPLLFILLAAVICSCDSFKSNTNPRKEAPQLPKGPEPGRHRITVTKLALSDSDFTNKALGGPKDLNLYAAKDGARIHVGKVGGFRGPKELNLTFEIDYDPISRYEFTIEEITMLTDARKWNLSSPKPGEWMFVTPQITFGSGSSISFLDQKVR